MRQPKILILTLSFGSGHVRAAENIRAELRRQMPEAELRMTDALENSRAWFRAFYVWTYWAMIRYAPGIWNRFFTARIKRRDEFTAPIWAWQKGCAEVFDKIKDFQPDVIIAAEVGASEIAVIARRAQLTKAEIINIITDFEAEPIWVKPEIALYTAATESVKRQLIDWGAEAEKVAVCGIPLAAEFGEKYDASEIRAHFNLDERPIVLLMGGGMGPTRMNEVAAELLKNGEHLQIVALAAKDRRARRALEKLNDSAIVSLRVFGWTNQVAQLMQIAAILVTKPGGLTLSEAAASNLPAVMFDAIPGPEITNAAVFTEARAGILTRGSLDTARQVLEILADKERCGAMARNCAKIADANAARRIVELTFRHVDFARPAAEQTDASPDFQRSRRADPFDEFPRENKSFSAAKGFQTVQAEAEK